MERIGIYGGTFNPPHVGHMAAAKAAVDLLRLDRLLLIPDRIAPHKELPDGSATAQQRLEMLQIAAYGIEKVEVSDMELCREGVSYTYLTVLELREQYPDAQLILLMGTDMFLSFDRWKNTDIILKNASLGVFYRGEKEEIQAIAQKKTELEALGATVELAENPVVSISSTDLRRLLVFRCADDFLPFGVNAYIQRRGLYHTARNYRHLPLDKLEMVVKSLLKPDRVAHVLGCRDTAVVLARLWGADETDAARAALLHDITKALDGPLQLTLCREYGILLDAFSRQNPKTLHALTGSLVAERIFGENETVVSAIRNHTTGCAGMTLLEKIIYVADYMEPNRDFPGVEKLRMLAFTDIDAALKLGLEMTITMLSQQGREISPESLDALNWLDRKD